MNRGLLLCALVALAAVASAVRLQNVDLLRFEPGEYAAGVRTRGVPKMKRVGGPDVDAGPITCRRVGLDDERQPVWDCKTTLPKGYELGTIDIQCEGLSGPGDEDVLPGSCAIEYEVRGAPVPPPTPPPTPVPRPVPMHYTRPDPRPIPMPAPMPVPRMPDPPPSRPMAEPKEPGTSIFGLLIFLIAIGAIAMAVISGCACLLAEGSGDSQPPSMRPPSAPAEPVPTAYTVDPKPDPPRVRRRDVSVPAEPRPIEQETAAVPYDALPQPVAYEKLRVPRVVFRENVAPVVHAPRPSVVETVAGAAVDAMAINAVAGMFRREKPSVVVSLSPPVVSTPVVTPSFVSATAIPTSKGPDVSQGVSQSVSTGTHVSRGSARAKTSR